MEGKSSSGPTFDTAAIATEAYLTGVRDATPSSTLGTARICTGENPEYVEVSLGLSGDDLNYFDSNPGAALPILADTLAKFVHDSYDAGDPFTMLHVASNYSADMGWYLSCVVL